MSIKNTELENDDYFDELEEIGYSKHSGINGHSPDFRSKRRGRFLSEDSEDLSELSDFEPPRPVLRFVDPTVGSSPTNSIRGRIESFDDTTGDEEDECIEEAVRCRKISGTRPPNFNKVEQSKGLRKVRGNELNEVEAIKSDTFLNRIKAKVARFPKHLPGITHRKKTKDYRIQIFVFLIFIVIAVLVGSIYVIHYEKELQKAYFDRIRFSGKDRRIRFINLKGREVLVGKLGMNLGENDVHWQCLKQHTKPNSPCLEWMDIARLHLNMTSPRKDWDSRLHNKMECYGILWESLSSEFIPKDCFSINEKRGFYFYGGGELSTIQWPLSKATVQMSPFITGGSKWKLGNSSFSSWGQSIRPFFVGSPGVTIEVSGDTPLHVSINEGEDSGTLCLAAKTDSFAFPSHSRLHTLKYRVCTGENIRDIFSELAAKEIVEEVHEDLIVAHGIASSSHWFIPNEVIHQNTSSEASLLNHTDRITELQTTQGYIILDESWQKELGDLEMDPARFTNIQETFNITKRRGFKVVLTISPFFSTQSKHYMRGVEKSIWVKQRIPNLYVPALTAYRGSHSVVLLDITKKSAKVWIQRTLAELARKYPIDALFIDFGSISNFPKYFDFGGLLISPDNYKEQFLRAVKAVTRIVPIIGTSGAVKLPKLPTFVSLSQSPSSWKSLQALIPNILTLGIAGYPFVYPGAIGGDYIETAQPVLQRKRPSHRSNITLELTSNSSSEEASFQLNSIETSTVSNISSQTIEMNASPTSKTKLPDAELYARWMELAHFLPAVQFKYLPNEYNKEMVELAQDLRSIRKTKVYLYVKKGINDALTKGLPIIRPLWMNDPTDLNCLKAWNEFTISGDILVAPILYPNKSEREIYLPKGRWRDELDGTITKGERWIHHYKAKLHQIPYFTRIIDDPI